MQQNLSHILHDQLPRSEEIFHPQDAIRFRVVSYSVKRSTQTGTEHAHVKELFHVFQHSHSGNYRRWNLDQVVEFPFQIAVELDFVRLSHISGVSKQKQRIGK